MAEAHRHIALIADVTSPFDRMIVEGVAGYIRSRGGWSVYFEEARPSMLPDLTRWRGDGIIADLDEHRVAHALARVRVPTVALGSAYPPDFEVPSVGSDNLKIGEVAARHLLDRGFRRFAYCGIRLTGLNRWSVARGEGFRRTVEAAGYPCESYVGRHSTARQWTAMLKRLMDWLKGLPKPVGLMACHDTRARHVIEACRMGGMRVPEEVAIIGVNNDRLMCELAEPPLSSVIQGTDLVGYEAARILDELIDGHRPASHRTLIRPSGITARRSTDVLAIEDECVSEAAAYIREHAASRIYVPDVQRAVGLSRRTLDSRFMHALGRTVHQEIERVRLQNARELLTGTDLPVRTIAARSGYSSEQYMVRVFRRKLGQTPGQFRSHRHSSDAERSAG